MLLYLLITCVPFFLFLKSLLFSLLPWPNPSETRISSPPLLLFFKHIFSSLSSPKPKPNTNTNMPLTKKKALTATTTSSSGAEDVAAAETSTSLLDLPELALDCILERLPPEALCGMAGVCASMRERCLSDRLWERHMRHKWGRVVGQAAHREWQWHVASRPAGGLMGSLKPGGGGGKQKGGLVRNILSLGWPFSWMMRSKVACDDNNNNNNNNYNNNGNNNSNGNSAMALPVDSIMAWYLALETGKFCFPAQVYNRENGHVGFMLSCYDAQISYDPKTDTFQARYPPHGRRAMAIETSVPWERLRAPPVETPPHDLHISDCLHELCPGDHIEIQWRRNKEFPYGWWYGMVGHLESCDGNENYCRCVDSDTVVLDFNQYTPGSRWRHTTVSRKDHREEGNEADGFYGGIRKLNKDDEISTWRQLWPTETLD